MNNIVRINIEEVEQPIGKMYIGKIDGKLLYNMSKVDIRRIGEEGIYCGMQRELDVKKVNAVKKYISSFDASFPNSIILNLNSKYIINKTKTHLEIEKTEDAFTVIDGQHRLSGFDGYIKGDKFELVVSIFIDLSISIQANLFKTINSEQKKVDRSLIFDLESYEIFETPRKFVRDVVVMFNSDKDSPWYKKIKIIGKKDDISTAGSINSKAFMEPILDFIYDDRDYYEIRNKLNLEKNKSRNEIFNNTEYNSDKYIFWGLYIDDNKELLYKILLNYYKALELCMRKEWKKKDTILNKAIGYYAIMLLFRDVYILGMKDGDLTQDNFEKILKPLSKMENINSERFGSSGAFTYTRIYNEMKKTLKL